MLIDNRLSLKGIGYIKSTSEFGQEELLLNKQGQLVGITNNSLYQEQTESLSVPINNAMGLLKASDSTITQTEFKYAKENSISKEIIDSTSEYNHMLFDTGFYIGLLT